jgi:pyridoxamine 5'-phosphate oxidase family protein
MNNVRCLRCPSPRKRSPTRDGQYYVGGMNPAKTRKFRNVQAGNPKVALVIDDLVSVNPWTPRYLRIDGAAELVPRRATHGPVVEQGA